ncbi:hypothetical protein FIBSPDRAFT_882164 [Athelia psychrophila]|uniref:Uncharacterized protein n=1 Tax=Athelia psychrophila TaxID=1759441 RepID=A0A166VKX0_9AGAM|nr:hypothetical protein FIBSPDRAFT_882164 [Fibularhizoctonia sp. CBS 109695]
MTENRLNALEQKLTAITTELTAITTELVQVKIKTNLAYHFVDAIFQSCLTKAAFFTVCWAQTTHMGKWVSPSDITLLDGLVGVIMRKNPTWVRNVANKVACEILDGKHQMVEPTQVQREWLDSFEEPNHANLPLHLRFIDHKKLANGDVKRKVTTGLLNDLEELYITNLHNQKFAAHQATAMELSKWITTLPKGEKQRFMAHLYDLVFGFQHDAVNEQSLKQQSEILTNSGSGESPYNIIGPETDVEEVDDGKV